MSTKRLLAYLAPFALLGCAASDDLGGEDCAEGKCDESADICTTLEVDARHDGFRAAPPAIRWSCGEWFGDNNQGSDYCEYFAVVDLPIISDDLEPTGFETQLAGRTGGPGVPSDNTRPELSEAQVFWLEDNHDAVIGQCVFTSWFSDVDFSGAPGVGLRGDGTIGEGGIALSAETFSMQNSYNSQNSARALLEHCSTSPADPSNAFYAGCELAGIVRRGEQKEWEFDNRANTFLCGGMQGLQGCDCQGTEAALATQIVPSTSEGFFLSSVGESLPAGCRALGDVADGVGNGVDGRPRAILCDLTATALLLSTPLVDRCNELYGDHILANAELGELDCTAPLNQCGHWK